MRKKKYLVQKGIYIPEELEPIWSSIRNKQAFIIDAMIYFQKDPMLKIKHFNSDIDLINAVINNSSSIQTDNISSESESENNTNTQNVETEVEQEKKIEKPKNTVSKKGFNFD